MTHDPPATFRQLVKAMRDAQKAEQRVRSRTNRRACLTWETRVDAWLARHDGERERQSDLFDRKIEAALNVDMEDEDANDA